MEIHFPEEIIVDILIRLHVSSLLRFKCASKFWKTLISDQYFKAKHYNYAKNNKKILITGLIPGTGTGTETDISYYCSSLSSSQPLQNLCCPSNHKPCDYMILCCCDGLALLWCPRGDHLLWNPSTNESVQLPNHETRSLFGSTYELGYDSISDDYKILMVEHMSNGPERPTKILALKSGSWRKNGNHPRGFRNKIIPCKNSLPFVRGAFHWLSRDSLLKYIMISFNISNEVYGEISLPEEICNISNVNYVRCVVFEGMLCAYCNGREGGLNTFKLW
uniref:Ubiquitin-protein ligase n=1 Tax=Solanum tuberosum TaxID=4113 RepID=M1DCM0_SOLTU